MRWLSLSGEAVGMTSSLSSPEASDNAIDVRHLHKSYGGRTVLDDITLTVRRGETLALLGPNGAGKTTLVETLVGFRHPDAGSVRLLGIDPRVRGQASRDLRNRVGVVLQETQESGLLTVREQLSHFAGFYDRPWNVEELIHDVGLSAAADRRVRTLSGGQPRRLDVAQGVADHPEVLFLDEPRTQMGGIRLSSQSTGHALAA